MDVQLNALYGDGENNRAERWNIRGLWREQNREAVGGGDNNVQVTFMINCRVLTHTIDGREVRHIDLEQDIHRVGGTDINAARRDALRGA